MPRDRVSPLLVVAGCVGAFMHILKGLVLIFGGPDLSLVPAMLFLFGLGMVGLYRRLPIRSGWTRSALFMAWSSVAFGLLSLGCQLAGWQPEDAADPVIADVAYGGGTLAVFVGLLLLGAAWARERSIPMPWRLVPLIVALVWFPLEALTAVLPDGWGLVLAGMTWIVAALAPVLAADEDSPAETVN